MQSLFQMHPVFKTDSFNIEFCQRRSFRENPLVQLNHAYLRRGKCRWVHFYHGFSQLTWAKLSRQLADAKTKVFTLASILIRF